MLDEVERSARVSLCHLSRVFGYAGGMPISARLQALQVRELAPGAYTQDERDHARPAPHVHVDHGIDLGHRPATAVEASIPVEPLHRVRVRFAAGSRAFECTIRNDQRVDDPNAHEGQGVAQAGGDQFVGLRGLLGHPWLRPAGRPSVVQSPLPATIVRDAARVVVHVDQGGGGLLKVSRSACVC